MARRDDVEDHPVDDFVPAADGLSQVAARVTWPLEAERATRRIYHDPRWEVTQEFDGNRAEGAGGSRGRSPRWFWPSAL